MVVPFNPWISLYFTAHINVEVVCSALHVIAYLFKYVRLLTPRTVQSHDSEKVG